MNAKLYCSKYYIYWKIHRSPVIDWQDINRDMYNKLFISDITPSGLIAEISRKSLYELSIFSPTSIPAFKLYLNKKIYFNLFP